MVESREAMATETAIGRNAPCPCGSGKKYKKCCLKEEERRARPAVSRLSSLMDEPVTPLLDHARRLHGDRIFEVFERHVGPYGHDFHGSAFLQVFVPWFLYFWTPEEEEGLSWSPEDTVAAHFLRERGRRVSRKARDLIERGRWAPFTFWQVMDVEADVGLHLKDFVTGREVFASEVSATRSVVRWDILFGRVVELEGESAIDGMGPICLPPSRFREQVEALATSFRETTGGDPDCLLSEHARLMGSYLAFADRATHAPAPKLQNMDGDRLVFVTIEFAFDPAVRGSVLMRLSGMRNIHLYDEQDGEAEFVWEVRSRGKPLDSIGKGRLFVGRETLRAECNSNARARRIRERIEKDLGDLVLRVGTTREDADIEALRARSAGLPEDSGRPENEALPDEAIRQVEDLMNSTYMQWADQKIPALDNQTPRDLVKFPDGRRRVADLINDLENSDARNPNPQFQFDYNRLRTELGLGTESGERPASA